MIPYAYNFVDMRGIDLAKPIETDMSGIYEEIIDMLNQCGDVILYNWKFAEIEIVPQYTTILVGDPLIINGSVYITSKDKITVPGTFPEMLQLEITDNGTYRASDYGVAGFDEVSVDVIGYGPFPSQETYDYVNVPRPMYAGGYEYASYIYGTALATQCGLVLLADASQGANSVQLTQPISNFSGIVLQGVYSKQIYSGFNTTIMYIAPVIGNTYWAGMKDRNSSYTCHVKLTSDTTATLTGNKQVLIFGIP